MIGAIRTRDILVHPVTTVRCFGWRVFLQSLVAGRNRTFLSLVCDHLAKPTNPPTAFQQIVARCVGLEHRAGEIYRRLADRLGADEPGSRFLLVLADQEQVHAQLLELCALAARGEFFSESHLHRWAKAVAAAERRLRLQRSAAGAVEQLNDALKLVVAIESSEINQLFAGIVGASDADFVARLSAFQTAGRQHLEFICREIPRLEPQLQESCDGLAATELAPV